MKQSLYNNCFDVDVFDNLICVVPVSQDFRGGGGGEFLGILPPGDESPTNFAPL
jgi:hypothetical protein